MHFIFALYLVHTVFRKNTLSWGWAWPSKFSSWSHLSIQHGNRIKHYWTEPPSDKTPLRQNCSPTYDSAGGPWLSIATLPGPSLPGMSARGLTLSRLSDPWDCWLFPVKIWTVRVDRPYLDHLNLALNLILTPTFFPNIYPNSLSVVQQERRLYNG